MYKPISFILDMNGHHQCSIDACIANKYSNKGFSLNCQKLPEIQEFHKNTIALTFHRYFCLLSNWSCRSLCLKFIYWTSRLFPQFENEQGNYSGIFVWYWHDLCVKFGKKGNCLRQPITNSVLCSPVCSCTHNGRVSGVHISIHFWTANL